MLACTCTMLRQSGECMLRSTAMSKRLRLHRYAICHNHVCYIHTHVAGMSQRTGTGLLPTCGLVGVALTIDRLCGAPRQSEAGSASGREPPPCADPRRRAPRHCLAHCLASLVSLGLPALCCLAGGGRLAADVLFRWPGGVFPPLGTSSRDECTR